MEGAVAFYDGLAVSLDESGAHSRFIAHALSSKAFALHKLGRETESLLASDEVLARYDGGTDPQVGARIARALYDKATSLARLNRLDEAFVVYDNLISRFGEAADPHARYEAVRALKSKGRHLLLLRRFRNFAPVADKLWTYRSDADDEVRDQVSFTQCLPMLGRRLLRRAS